MARGVACPRERLRACIPVRASPCVSVRRQLGAAAPAGGSAVPRSLSPAPLAPATPAIALPPLRRRSEERRVGKEGDPVGGGRRYKGPDAQAGLGGSTLTWTQRAAAH